MDPAIVSALVGAPPWVAVIYYLIVRGKADAEARAAELARRDAIDKDRIETDKALVAVLARIETKVGVSP